MSKGSRRPKPRGAGLVCQRHRALPGVPTSEHNPPPRAQHTQEPLPSPAGTPRAAGEPRSALHHPPSRTPAPGEGSATRGSGTLRAFPRATATLTGLHGEEEEEEGGGRAPAAGGRGPGARQPGHGVAGASAGCGARCAPGAYVGHAPSRPAGPRRRIDWWKLRPAVATGTASSPPESHRDPQPRSRTPRCSRAGTSPCGTRCWRHRRTEPHAWPRRFVPRSLHSGHSSVASRSPRLMGIHAGSSPSPWHPRCRQELPALFPAFAAKRPPVRPVRPPWPPARPDTSWGASPRGWGPPKPQRRSSRMGRCWMGRVGTEGVGQAVPTPLGL